MNENNNDAEPKMNKGIFKIVAICVVCAIFSATAAFIAAARFYANRFDTVRQKHLAEIDRLMTSHAETLASRESLCEKIDTDIQDIRLSFRIFNDSALRFREDMKRTGEAVKDASVSAMIINENNYLFLERVMADLYDRMGTRQFRNLRQQLCEDFEAFEQSAKTTQEKFDRFEKTYKSAFETTRKMIPGLKKNTLKFIEDYDHKMDDVEEFLSMPIKLDFDPKKDVRFIKRRIQYFKSELAKLKQLDEEFQDMQQLPVQNPYP